MNGLLARTLHQALARASGVELASPRTVSGIDGRRVGRRSGNALEFAEYRDYRPGDDPRRLDWGVYARTGQLTVKLYSEEVDPRCDLLLDHSASMAAGSEAKAPAAFALCALLAQAAVNGGFSLAVWHAGETLTREPVPGHPGEWSGISFDAARNPGELLSESALRFQSRGIRIVVSDFLWAEEPGAFLRRIADGAMRVALVEVLSREDLSPSGSGNALLRDPESGEVRELEVTEGVISRYRQRLEAHRALWERAAAGYGALRISMCAEELLARWDLSELFRCGILK